MSDGLHAGAKRRRVRRLLAIPPVQLVVAFVAYGATAQAAYWPTYPGDPSRLPDCGCGDVAQSVWYIAYLPYALLTHHSPFHTSILNYPQGSNLAISAEMLGLGLLTAPLTRLVSPIASYNLLMWLAFSLSATSMFYVVRRWTKSALAAFVAGGLYGFGPYMASEGLSHLNLTFVPIPPLIFLCLYEIFVASARIGLWGGALGVLVVLQYFISAEVLATTWMVAILALVVLAVSRPKLVVSKIRRAMPGLLIATTVVVAGTAYPVWYSLGGPDHLNYPIHGSYNPYSADLLGSVVPTDALRLYPIRLKAIGARFVLANPTENGDYLGLPLLALTTWAAWRMWRDRWSRFLVVMIGLTIVLSLGSYLAVDAHQTSLPLPFHLVANLPVFENILTARIALYVIFFVALLVALALAETVKAPRTTIDHGRYKRSMWRGLALCALLAVTAASLVPSWPYPSVRPRVPSFFAGRAVDTVPAGAVVLAYPYPFFRQTDAMLWDALSRMRFQLVGGYNLFTLPGGVPSAFPAILQPEAVETVLIRWGYSYSDPPTTIAHPRTATPQSVMRFVRLNHVQVVLVDPSALNAQRVVRLVRSAFGRAPARLEGMDMWIARS